MVKYTLQNAVIKCLVVTLCLLLCSASLSVQADSANPPVLPDTSSTNVDRPCVILYYTLYIRWKWSSGKVLTGSFWAPNKERSCIITSKRDYLPRIEDYDALIFFEWNVKENTEFPPQDKRRPEQLYILHNQESPQRSINRTQMNPYSHLFNLTMSYRLDADIVLPYSRVYDKITHHQVAPTQNNDVWLPVDSAFVADKRTLQMVAAKKKLISWVVSNCQDDPSERMALVDSLRKFVPVDIYGKCGQPCSKCMPKLGREYFFYLAFENSLAVDYVSEKAFMMLGRGTIPVVYGGADYSKFLPPKSYINAQHFNTTKELADFLIALSKDQEEYLSYFWWRDHYDIVGGHMYADVCQRVLQFKRDIGAKVRFFTSLELWEQRDTWTNRTIQFV